MLGLVSRNQMKHSKQTEPITTQQLDNVCALRLCVCVCVCDDVNLLFSLSTNHSFISHVVAVAAAAA